MKKITKLEMLALALFATVCFTVLVNFYFQDYSRSNLAVILYLLAFLVCGLLCLRIDFREMKKKRLEGGEKEK